MRTKDDILNDARSDIRNKSGDFPGSFWLRYRELEVQIDIRDILYSSLNDEQVAILLKVQRQ